MAKYKVGYGKPPKQHQFKPGESGNKRGRPPNSNNALTILNKRLSSKITIKEGERKVQISKLDALVMQTINSGLKGNLKAASMIFDLLDRKGLMDNVDMASILPENHQDILKEFVKQKSKEKKAKKKTKRKKERQDD
jgi:hypothetical protein